MFKFLTVIFVFILAINCELTPVVKTKTGPVQGEILKTVIDHVPYSSFKGIPYAEPPLGNMRFRQALEKTPWTTVLKATVEGPDCPQMDFVYGDRYTGSEDCLYLNVYTPKTDFKQKTKTPRAVMVWIYGGRWVSGYSNSSIYGPDFMMEDGTDIVLVTFNYRLGALGFLSLHIDGATGNAAMKDQVLALKWVQQNIHLFGGDPNNVTLAGQDVGGVAVDLHVLSDMTNGYFHRAISMSASPLNSWEFQSPIHSEMRALKLCYKLGLPENSTNKKECLSILQKASPEDLVKYELDLAAELRVNVNPAIRPFRPTTEDPMVAADEEKFITECPYTRYVNGRFEKMPYLTGFVNDEAVRLSKNMKFITSTLERAAKRIKLTKDTTNASFAGEESDKKIDEIVVPKTETEQLSAFTDFSTFEIDMKREFLQKNNNGQPIYYYRLSHDVYNSLHRLMFHIDRDGVTHGDDINYLFRTTIVKQPLGPNDPEKIIRRRIIRLWTNFVKYGNPTPHYKNELLGMTWPESGTAGRIFNIKTDTDMIVESRPTNRLITLLRNYKPLLPKDEVTCKNSFF